jgi:hypothetical protein
MAREMIDFLLLLLLLLLIRFAFGFWFWFWFEFCLNLLFRTHDQNDRWE